MSKIKISAVSYLNTKPFLYGIFKSGLDKYVDLQLDIPSVGAKKLINGEVDLALSPVAIIPEMKTPHIVSDYCIGAVNAVKTVCVFSNVPLEKVTHLLLDYHSRTSVALVQILMKKYWKLQPIFSASEENTIEKIENTTAAVLIGDKTIGLDLKFPYIYDLASAWIELTQLPFVFATWLSNKALDEGFIKDFNAALQLGLDYIPQLTQLIPAPEHFDLNDYFTKNISYHLDSKKKQGLNLFLKELDALNSQSINRKELIFV